MKRFGFHPEQLYFNTYNSRKVRYLSNPQLGAFEVPKNARFTNLNEAYENYQKRLDFERYMNPKGLKPTITSNFRKPQPEIDFVNHEARLMRSPKDYGKEWVSFRMAPFLSKPEIQQYMMKLYNIPVQKVNTALKQGKIIRNMDKGGHWRKKDWKKAMIKVDFDVDPDLQKLQ